MRRANLAIAKDTYSNVSNSKASILEKLKKLNEIHSKSPSHYDYYSKIKRAKNHHHVRKKHTHKKNKFIRIAGITLLLILIAFFFFGGALTGQVIEGEQNTFTESLNKEFSKTSEFVWSPLNLGEIESIKISGEHKDSGEIKIFIEDELIYNYKKITSSSPLTGQVTGEGESESKILNFFRKIFGTLTGQVAEGDSGSSESSVSSDSDSSSSSSNSESQSSTSSSDSSSSSESASDSKSESSTDSESTDSSSDDSTSEDTSSTESPSEETKSETPVEETQAETPLEEITEETISEEEAQKKEDVEEPIDSTTAEEEINKTDVSPSLNESSSVIEENITETIPEEETPTIKEPVIEKEELLEEEFLINFTEFCQDTCKTKLNKSNYTIRVEISNSELNLKEIIYTLTPETIIEENLTVIEETDNLTIQTIQEIARINTPVKWKKIIQTNKTASIEIEIPEEAEYIQVEDLKQKEEIPFLITEEPEIKPSLFSTLTGQVSKEKEDKKPKKIKIKTDRDNAGYEIEYETPGPTSTEEIISRGIKLITIEDVSEFGYKDITAFTYLSEEITKEGIHLFHTENGIKTETEFTAFDNNSNGKIEYIEWIVPHLSKQNYELQLTILNIQSYPVVGENWTVNFETTGTGNLTISAIKNTSFGETSQNDLKFIEVTCNNKQFPYTISQNSIIIENYSCKQTGKEISQVLTPGVHNLEFDFSGVKGYANNLANYASKTCSQQWGFSCAANPDNDNTFDNCENAGQYPDEIITEIYLNSTTVNTGTPIEAICTIDPYGTQDEVYMWYYNGTGWKTIFSGQATGSTNYNLTQTIVADNIAGTHWVRCGIGYDNDPDIDTTFCVNEGSYFDNDDISFDVESTMPLEQTKSCGAACDQCNQPGTPVTDNCDAANVANCGGDGSEGYFHIKDIIATGKFTPGGEINISVPFYSGYDGAIFVTGWQNGVKLNEFGCVEIVAGTSSVITGKDCPNCIGPFANDETININAKEGDYHLRATYTYYGTCDNPPVNDCQLGNYGENDGLDISLVSTAPANTPPTTPLDIVCDGGSCDKEINKQTILQTLGSTDSESDEITYNLEASLKTTETETQSLSKYLSVSGGISSDPTPQTCSGKWGWDCSTGPPETGGNGGDNTVDSCVTGSGNDESVEEIYLNATSAAIGDTLSVSCEYDLYTSGDDTAIWYYNGLIWTKLKERLNWGSSTIVNETASFVVSGNVGEQYVRCIASYYDLTGECATQSYSDNDDLTFIAIAAGGASNNDDETPTSEYTIPNSAKTNIDEIEIIIETDFYDSRSSISELTTKPDLFLEIFNGVSWIPLGNLGLPSTYTGNNLYVNDENFSKTTTDPTILTAWKTAENQKIRIRGVLMDYTSDFLYDAIAYKNIYVNTKTIGWFGIGSHTESASYIWNTTNIEEQKCINLRASAIDLFGNNTNSSYFTKNSCLNISHQEATSNPPTIEQNSPQQDYTKKTIGPTDITFSINASDDVGLTECSLYHNATGIWHKNQTKSASGLTEDISFTLTKMFNVSFIWNVECLDTDTQNTFGENRVITLIVQSEIIPGNDFKIQRGETIINAGQLSATINAGADYEKPTGPAFIRITNTRLSGMGKTSGGGNQNSVDFTTYISNPSNIETSIDFTRFGTTNNNRISWEIIEYAGATGGKNEFKIRQSGVETFTTTGLTKDTGIISGISDDNDIVIFITGQANPDIGRNDANTGMHTAEWIPVSDTARFTRGESGADATKVSYAIIEFTGENWKIQRKEHIFTAAGSIQKEYITPVSDLTKAFLHVQHRTGNTLNGLDEQGSQVYFSSPSEISYKLISGAGFSNSADVAWVIENTQTMGTPMRVQHISGTRPVTGSEEDTWTDSITQISSMDSASIMGECADSTGTGTALPRGWNNILLLDDSTVEHKRSDNGQTQNYRYSVVEWPTFPNTVPKINKIYQITDVSFGLNEGPLKTQVTIKFEAEDNESFENLNDSSAKLTLSKTGETTRTATCSKTETSGNIANYTCVADMWWWDKAGSWKIEASIKDKEDNIAIHDTNTLSVGQTIGFVTSQTSLTWNQIKPGAINQEANEVIIISNTGNAEKGLELNATNLYGTVDNSLALYATDFKVGPNAGCTGTIMSHHAFTQIVGATIPVGNYTIGDGTGQEELYVCLFQSSNNLTTQDYTTSQDGNWILRIFSVLLTVAGVRRKKKKDELIGALKIIFGQFKDSDLLSDEEILSIVKPKQKIKTKKESIEIKDNEIPLEIFTKDLGALESITKYLKENKNLSYGEIAILLNRNQKTIWTSYNKASNKNNSPIIISNKECKTIPIEIYKNKNLTILESTIFFLKKENMKYSEIGKLLNRNERNIWTINNRMQKKIVI